MRLLILVAMIGWTGGEMKADAAPTIIPKPVRMTVDGGSFTITPETRIVAHGSTAPLGKQFADLLSPAMGFVLKAEAASKNAIHLEIGPAFSELGDEVYELNVVPDGITIQATTEAGLFYGIQSLRQLLPPQIFSATHVDGVVWKLPCVHIVDYPRFKWRGLMLDCGRHFMPKDDVKRFIDAMAVHKMNSFHWHLTEDQGWRIEIKKYPKLTEVGGWRKETLVGHASRRPWKFDGVRHGGFYTQDDIREIVKFAAQRHINIVPEIEMPGHSQAAIAAYPELGCTDKQLDVFTGWGVDPNILNPDEKTILFYQDVLSEVLDLFPSKFIHVGGDEAVKEQWKSNPRVQARMKELNLKDEHAMQSYFIRRMDQFLASKGRRLIGWDEILEGGLAPGATVMSWHGDKGGIAAALSGHDVVMAPNSHTYFDHYQADKSKEPLAIGGFLSIQTVYGYDPVPASLTAVQAKHILGTQGQIWTEYIPNAKQAEYMAYPRACALAEVAWTPKDEKNYDDFARRLETHMYRLKALDINSHPYAPGERTAGEKAKQRK